MLLNSNSLKVPTDLFVKKVDFSSLNYLKQYETIYIGKYMFNKIENLELNVSIFYNKRIIIQAGIFENCRNIIIKEVLFKNCLTILNGFVFRNCSNIVVHAPIFAGGSLDFGSEEEKF